MTDKPNYGVAVPAFESGPWRGLSLEEWLGRFRLNASTSPEGSPHIVHRSRQDPGRTAEAFPFVQGEHDAR